MGKLYTALSVRQYSELLRKKTLPLLSIEDDKMGLIFTEDKNYWIDKLKKQEDLEFVTDYKYAAVIEFEMEAKNLETLIQSESGRFSSIMIEYYKTLNKPIVINEYNKNDTDVICLLDVYNCIESHDGISQKWMLDVQSENSSLWIQFSNGVYKISCVGAIPDTIEEAKKMLQE